MKDTIVAQATPIGRGGVGILRVSGPLASKVAEAVLGKNLNAENGKLLAIKRQQRRNTRPRHCTLFLKHQTLLLAKMSLSYKATVVRLF